MNGKLIFPVCAERTIARHEVAEVEQRHSEDSGRDPSSLSDREDMVIIYNRVPKTASTSFTNIAYDLCGKNRFHVLHINTTKNNPVMSLQDQVRPAISERVSYHIYSLFNLLQLQICWYRFPANITARQKCSLLSHEHISAIILIIVHILQQRTKNRRALR